MPTKYRLIAVLFTALFSCVAQADIRKGDKLQLLANIHPDMERATAYSLNYQLNGGHIPVCTDVTVLKVNAKVMIFEWNGRKITFQWDKHTRKAGVPLAASLSDFFGSRCDADKLDKMSEIDKKGIKQGTALVGMTREGVLVAMGRPPYHVNPIIEASSWLYWNNRFSKREIIFDDKGIVKGIR